MNADQGAAGGRAAVDRCRCAAAARHRVGFHGERQDTSAPGWSKLLAAVEEAAADGREEFAPLAGLSAQERRQVVTLPARIGALTRVRRLVLYGSNLVRLPAEVGLMRALEEFVPYTSYRLHWFPYELARLPALRRSTVSTRALYGNPKLRPPFPELARPTAGADLAALDPGRWGAESIGACSVCDGPVAGAGALRQAWVSLRTSGPDVRPLLVNACSEACLGALPSPPAGYAPGPHRGGPARVPLASAELELSAGGSGLCVRDGDAAGEPVWTAGTPVGGLVVGDEALGVAAAAGARLAVTVEVFAGVPAADHGRFEHVAEATVDVPSGVVAVLGGDDLPPGAATFPVPAGYVRVRVSRGGPSARMRIRLWPEGEHHREPLVARRADGGSGDRW